MTIRHNCELGGCFIKTQSPDWGFADNAFSGKIRIGDIDGIVEKNGHLLILEWKAEGVPETKGQQIMAQNATLASPNITFMIINGNPITNQVVAMKIYYNGTVRNITNADNDYFCDACKKWEQFAVNNAIISKCG